MIRTLDDISPETLTAVLASSGRLARGRVTSVHLETIPNQVPFSAAHQLHRLALHYSHPTETLPEFCFLKFGRSNKECTFYTEIAPSMDHTHLPDCLYAGYSSETGQTCLILEDLSRSHFQTEWPLPPALEQCQQAVSALAGIHACWWQQPVLEEQLRPKIPAGRSWQERCELAIHKIPAFLSFLGGRLSRPRQQVYRQLASTGARPWQPRPGEPCQTLLHGDFHAWNVFYPIPGRASGVRIFDWNMWDIGRPTDDLAYFMALHWYPERRARLEAPLLQHYHAELARAGIDYPFGTLWQHYRCSAVRSLLIPVWQWQRSTHPAIWWPHLERAFLAFEDLRGWADNALKAIR